MALDDFSGKARLCRHLRVKEWQKQEWENVERLSHIRVLAAFPGAMKDVLPVVSARDQMIQPTLDLNPHPSRHHKELYQ